MVYERAAGNQHPGKQIREYPHEHRRHARFALDFIGYSRYREPHGGNGARPQTAGLPEAVSVDMEPAGVLSLK
jgi:hypothetical protein